jgi:hypothetical protein
MTITYLCVPYRKLKFSYCFKISTMTKHPFNSLEKINFNGQEFVLYDWCIQNAASISGMATMWNEIPYNQVIIDTTPPSVTLLHSRPISNPALCFHRQSLYPEDRGTMVFQNFCNLPQHFGILPQYYTVSQPRRLKLEFSKIGWFY